MAFISGNNLGGKNIDYYDNPNYDPKKDGKSSTDYIKKSAQQSADWAKEANQQYYEVGIDYDYVVEAEGQAAYDKLKADKQASETVSYFRAKERERLNPGGIGGPQINPKFAEPSGTLGDKLLKTESKKDTPFKNTVADVNRELQAIKARTRDAAMEFRGRVYDFIEEVTQNLNDDFAYQSIEWDRVSGGPPIAPASYSSIENKYFPNTGEKSQARNTILKMIDSTDNEAPLNSLRGVTEEIAAVKDPGLRDMGIGAAKTNRWGASNENTLKNLESGIKEFQAWKAKKGVPRIIRLIKNLP
jgi:hypothetical protein